MCGTHPLAFGEFLAPVGWFQAQGVSFEIAQPVIKVDVGDIHNDVHECDGSTCIVSGLTWIRGAYLARQVGHEPDWQTRRGLDTSVGAHPYLLRHRNIGTEKPSRRQAV